VNELELILEQFSHRMLFTEDYTEAFFVALQLSMPVKGEALFRHHRCRPDITTTQLKKLLSYF
jgi:hypothetical protein